MVCPRCIMAVEQILQNQAIPFVRVELGKVQLNSKIDEKKLKSFEEEISKIGFALLKDRDAVQIEKIKNLLSELFLKEEIPSGFLLSDFIKSHIPEDYSSISQNFSSMEGITLEKYFIQKKIEKVKEWLFYEELTLSEMAWKLDYSSVQHLSSQFKKITGMTPTEFRKLNK